jgi:hypothetical protein
MAVEALSTIILQGYDCKRTKERPVLSELMRYIARVALFIAILLAFSVAVYIVGKLRGKK